MEKSLGKEFKNPIERINFLDSNCDKVEQKGYMKRYTPEQVQCMKEELAETSIKINDIQIEKKEYLKEIKERITPLSEQKSELLKGIKEKAAFTTEKCYKFIDQEDKEVGYYNADGDLIEERPAMPDELQGTVFQMQRKTGTNN